MGSSKRDLATFPEAARRQSGSQLRQIQRGHTPSDSKPMSVIGDGVEEIRVRASDGAYRIFYIARFEEAIYVLHAFQKQSQKTSTQDIQLGQKRYQQMLALRRDRQGR